ncbi:MAG: adenylosuccinate synthetase [Malacoplasma sp.]
MNNSFIYKLNKNIKNEFILNNSDNYKNYFIIEDVDLIKPFEIIRLLKKGRKIIFGDFSIINSSYLHALQELLSKECESYINSLFISKEIYIKTKSFNDYAETIQELEFNKKLTKKDIFLSDKQLQCALKIKDLYNRDETVRKLDQSTFLKNLVFERFSLPLVEIETEIIEITNSVIFFKKYLIESVTNFFERNDENNICFAIDKDLTSNYKSISSKNIGIVSAIDFNRESQCLLTDFQLEILNNNQIGKCGWIDIVKLKNHINTLNIDEIVIENLDLYNNFEEIQVCNEYGIKNYSTKIFASHEHENVIPFYIKFDGWNKDVANISDEKEIPIELLYFLNEIKKLMGIKVITTKLNYLEIRIGQ